MTCDGISLNGIPLTDLPDQDVREIIKTCTHLKNIIRRRCPKLKTRALRRGPVKVYTKEEIRRMYE